jgi:DedD protein
LGSFGEKANAEGLIARLQERGHKAFARPIQTSRGTLTGVYVGPVLTEREAGRLQQELAGAFELEGVVVQFSLDDLAN